MTEVVLGQQQYGDHLIQRVLLEDATGLSYVVQRGYWRVGTRLFDHAHDAKTWIDHGHADRDDAAQRERERSTA